MSDVSQRLWEDEPGDGNTSLRWTGENAGSSPPVWMIRLEGGSLESFAPLKHGSWKAKGGKADNSPLT